MKPATREAAVAKIFEYVPHPHAEERKVAGPPTVAAAVAQLHGPGPIGRFNAKMGLKITLVVGTMWCAYLFTVLALISAPSAFKTGNTIIMVAWIAQTFLQLVLLPIIIVGQNVQAAASDARAESDHETLLSIHTLTAEVYVIAQQQTKILEILEERNNTAKG
jgi:hypothetical protein